MLCGSLKAATPTVFSRKNKRVPNGTLSMGAATPTAQNHKTIVLTTDFPAATFSFIGVQSLTSVVGCGHCTAPSIKNV